MCNSYGFAKILQIASIVALMGAVFVGHVGAEVRNPDGSTRSNADEARVKVEEWRQERKISDEEAKKHQKEIDDAERYWQILKDNAADFKPGGAGGYPAIVDTEDVFFLPSAQELLALFHKTGDFRWLALYHKSLVVNVANVDELITANAAFTTGELASVLGIEQADLKQELALAETRLSFDSLIAEAQDRMTNFDQLTAPNDLIRRISRDRLQRLNDRILGSQDAPSAPSE